MADNIHEVAIRKVRVTGVGGTTVQAVPTRWNLRTAANDPSGRGPGFSGRLKLDNSRPFQNGWRAAAARPDSEGCLLRPRRGFRSLRTGQMNPARLWRMP